MANYLFRYTNMSGGVVRSTIMQCKSDDDAIHHAQSQLPDGYSTLEISEGDRLVHRHAPSKMAAG